MNGPLGKIQNLQCKKDTNMNTSLKIHANYLIKFGPVHTEGKRTLKQKKDQSYNK